MPNDIINEELKKLPASQYDIAILNHTLINVNTKLDLLVQSSKNKITCADHEVRIRVLEKHKNIIYGAIIFITATLPFIVHLLFG